ncbi:hypothetical protein DPMN_037940 [Dreissena polymorpha]|uniref:Uncharacterized protein n=1 Tax=Dreissena polymorpha TaxID=45954 RepID=A0A9D4MBU8_DREPO|nr:hypothetical protein DPMN_037940 [Dreissena polymorpha]
MLTGKAISRAIRGHPGEDELKFDFGVGRETGPMHRDHTIQVDGIERDVETITLSEHVHRKSSRVKLVDINQNESILADSNENQQQEMTLEEPQNDKYDQNLDGDTVRSKHKGTSNYEWFVNRGLKPDGTDVESSSENDLVEEETLKKAMSLLDKLLLGEVDIRIY